MLVLSYKRRLAYTLAHWSDLATRLVRLYDIASKAPASRLTRQFVRHFFCRILRRRVLTPVYAMIVGFRNGISLVRSYDRVLRRQFTAYLSDIATYHVSDFATTLFSQLAAPLVPCVQICWPAFGQILRRPVLDFKRDINTPVFGVFARLFVSALKTWHVERRFFAPIRRISPTNFLVRYSAPALRQWRCRSISVYRTVGY